MTELLRLVCRSMLAVFVMLSASAAWSHPGHLAGLAGHDHWVAGAAIGLAIALGIFGALKGKTSESETAEAQSEDRPGESTEPDAETDEVPA